MTAPSEGALRQPRIVTRCPSCGGRHLFIGTGGHLTCSLIECPEPWVGKAMQDMKSRLATLEGLLREVQAKKPRCECAEMLVKKMGAAVDAGRTEAGSVLCLACRIDAQIGGDDGDG